MQSNIEEKILSNPKYRALVAKQSKLRWCCAGGILLAYFIFVIVAFSHPDILAAKVSENSIVPIGIPLSFLVFVIQLALTIVYARLESGSFASIKKEIIAEAKA